MTRSETVRQWFVDNPGWHFMADILDGIGVEGRERKLSAICVGGLSGTGHLIAVGARTYKRYTLGRPTRAYTIKGKSNAG